MGWVSAAEILNLETYIELTFLQKPEISDRIKKAEISRTKNRWIILLKSELSMHGTMGHQNISFVS